MTFIARRIGMAAVALSVALGGAAGLTASSAWASEAVFVISSTSTGVQTMNPIKTTVTSLAFSLVYDRLVEQDADQSFHPHLATSWKTSADGMSMTFKLRKGVTFQDGTPFNAQTIAWWIPKFKGTDNEYMVAAIDKVEVIDNYTVRFAMKHPDANILYNLASGFMGIPSPKAYDKVGDQYGINGAVGTGPYKFVRFTPGVEYVLTRNDDYAWASDLSKNQGPAKIETLTLREIGDDASAFLELKTGGVDLVDGVPTNMLAQYKKIDNAEIRNMPGDGIFYIAINTTAPPFTDINVREATSLAINRQAIVDYLYAGVGRPARNFLIHSLPAADIPEKFDTRFDPKKANELLDKAGWAMGADGVRVKDGKPLTVKLWARGTSEFKRMAEVLQAQFKAIGMQAEISVFDKSTIRDQYKKNAHQLALRSYGWNNADILDWFFSAERLGYPNVSMWVDAKAEKLRKTAMTKSLDMAERIANFKIYNEYVMSQYVSAPIYEPVQTLIFRSDRLDFPKKIHGTAFRGQTVVDISVK